MKIAYIGIDILSAALRALLRCGCEIAEVFTCETDNKTEFNREIIAIAEEISAPLKVGRITPDDLRRLEREGVDAIICAGYYHKVPTETSIPLINIHPALLPVGRGAWPMPLTILRGLRESGVTFHKMTARFDEGDVILKRAFALSEREDLESFMRKVLALVDEMIPTLVADLPRLYREAKPQSGGEYWQMPTEADYTVREGMSASEADLILRAFFGYECILEQGGKRFELIRGRVVYDEPQSGEFFSLSDGAYIVADSVEEL